MASGSCAPHQQVEHMAAPTEAQCIKKTLANGEPSTHGAKRTCTDHVGTSAYTGRGAALRRWTLMKNRHTKALLASPVAMADFGKDGTFYRSARYGMLRVKIPGKSGDRVTGREAPEDRQRKESNANR